MSTGKKCLSLSFRYRHWHTPKHVVKFAEIPLCRMSIVFCLATGARKKTEQEIFSLAEKMQSSVKREARKKETYNDIIKNINFKSISIRFVYSCTRCVLFSSRSFLSLSIACAVVIVVPSFCFASIVTLARPCNLSFFIFHFGKEECLFTLRWDERKRDHTSGELNHIHTEIRWKQEQKQKIDATAGHTTKFIYQSNTCNFGVV